MTEAVAARSIAAAVVLVFAAVLTVPMLSSSALVAFDDIGQLVAAVAAAAGCLFAARRRTSIQVRAAWWLLGGACASWAAGEGVWTYYEVVVHQAAPFPSLADAGFLGFPVLAAAALLVLPGQRRSSAEVLRNLLDGLIIAGSLLVLAWSTSLGAALDAGGPTQLSTAIALAYPLGDALVITLVLLVIGRSHGGQREVLALVSAGLLALTVADSSFVYLTSNGTYTSGSAFDIGWFAGFVLIALAGVRAASTAQTVGQRPSGLPTWLRLTLPYPPLTLALGVIVAQLVTGDHHAPAAEIWAGALLVVAVLVRQFLTLADHRRLLVDLHDQRELARRQALHDALTGLANRTLFIDRVELALATRSPTAAPVAVLFCDLDGFKSVNDRFGHAAGDTLLKAVADQLVGALRPNDTVARMGGDEFAVLIQQHGTEPAQVAARLAEAMTRVIVAGTGTAVRMSIGVAAAALEGIGADELLRQADAAMYAAKAAGNASWATYDPAAHRGPERPDGAEVVHAGEH